MDIAEIKKLANDHCWKEDAKCRLKAAVNILELRRSQPEESYVGITKECSVRLAAQFADNCKTRLFEIETLTSCNRHIPVEHPQCLIRWKQLNPRKGYLRVLRVIRHFNAQGVKPFKADCRAFITLKFGCTYRHDQIFAALHMMGLADFEKGWTVTALGKILLKAEACLDMPL